MRMRRKKNLEPRTARCEKVHITEPQALKGKWEERFGRKRPLWLEIGCGKGGFICALAARHPERNFVAVEKYGNVLVTACEAAQQQGLSNIRFLWGDAEYLSRYLPAHSIAGLYLNFSTPFPKKAYAIHRLTHRHFLAMYRQLLAPGARLVQKTDDRRLFQFSLEELSQSGYVLEQVSLDLHADGDPENIVTEYEQKFVDQGLPIYRLIAHTE